MAVLQGQVVDEGAFHEGSFPMRPIVHFDPHIVVLRIGAIAGVGFAGGKHVVAVIAVEAAQGYRALLQAKMRHAGKGTGENPMFSDPDGVVRIP